MQKKLKSQIALRITASFLALLVIVGIAIPVLSFTNVDAALTALVADRKIYINDDNYPEFGAGLDVYAYCYDENGTYLGESKISAEGDGYSFTALGGTASVEVERENTALLESAPYNPVVGNKRRVYFHNTSGLSDVHAYSWYMDGADAVKGLGNWPGTEMTQVVGEYYYIDIPLTDEFVMFNNGKAVGSTKTDTITISTTHNLYTQNTNRWTNLGIESVIEIDMTERPTEKANTVYITGAESYKWSKYASPLAETMETVYVYAPLWKEAYVLYDPNDPLTIVSELENVTAEGDKTSSATGFFKAQVPEGSTFVFRPKGDNTAGSTIKLSSPPAFEKPCYNISEKTWSELGADKAYSDYVVTNKFDSNILGVKATYYDYLSDAEYNGAWLNPIQAGTNYSNSEDNWYPFYIFNQKLSKVASANKNWANPLYVGNFCNTGGAYDSSAHNGGWSNATSDNNAYNFKYLPNNSNALKDSSAVVQGLVEDSLTNGNLMVTDSLRAPYFDNDWLHNNKLAKIVEGDFPFVITDKGSYKEYSFDSGKAKDNVYFTWDTEGKETYPTRVNYAKGTNYGGTYYGIDDGIKYFMYNGTSGKGFFPFNNASGTKGEKTYANENLNYGFGIRMDMDFRVPEGGVIPGTSDPILFEFEGDDDLWVFITDNETGESKLLLDMGGAHAKSSGKIDFSREVATVEKAHTITAGETSSDPRFVYLSKSNTSWGTPYAYFFNDGGAVGKSWPGTAMTKSDSNYKIQIPEGATKVIFSNNGNGQTGNIDLTATSGAYWLSSSLEVNEWDETPDNAGLGTAGSVNYGTKVKNDFSEFFDNQNDQKTYTMTVFYMERGLIESNMKINFTMTPLDNDLTVANKIDAADINSGIRDVVLETEKMTYTVYDDDKKATDAVYTDQDGKEGKMDGSFLLGNTDSVMFDAQFDTGSEMDIADVTADSGIEYTTTWKLYDNNTGELLLESTASSAKEALFDLINASNDSNIRTSLYLGYVNTPKTDEISVKKLVQDENGKDISADSTAVFEYQIVLDILENEEFEIYSLDYDLYSKTGVKIATLTAKDGKFSLQAGQKAVFKGMPIGVEYRVTESIKGGYELGFIEGGTNSANSGYSVTADIDDNNDIIYTNIYKPVSTTLSAYKTLAGDNYTGNDFKFRLTGLESRTLGAVTTADTSKVIMETNTVTDGKLIFANTEIYTPFTFGDEGVYCYKISEINTNMSGYVYDTTEFFAMITVSADSEGKLTASEPQYFSDKNFTQQISGTQVKFENNYKPVSASLSVSKSLDDEAYSGTEFEFMCEGVGESTAGTSMKVNTSEDGKVTFANTADNTMFTYTKPGTYCYKLYEVMDADNMAYIFDDTEYFAKVIVTADADTGKLSTAVSYFSDSGMKNPAEPQISNETAKCSVYIYKKNFNNTAFLEGAKFILVPAVKENGIWVEDKNSDYVSGEIEVKEIDGMNPAALFKDVPQGDYIIKETKAPKGYELSALTPHLEVRKTAENDAVVEFDFFDTEVQLLPNSGGKGYALGFTVAAVLLSLSAVCWIYGKKSKKPSVVKVRTKK